MKGALIGVLIGGGGTMVATEGKDVTLPAGTILRVRMDTPPEIWVSWALRPTSCRIASRAALIVAAMSRSVWAAERNQASNCDGRRVDAAVEHGVEEPAVGPGVGLQR